MWLEIQSLLSLKYSDRSKCMKIFISYFTEPFDLKLSKSERYFHFTKYVMSHQIKRIKSNKKNMLGENNFTQKNCKKKTECSIKETSLKLTNVYDFSALQWSKYQISTISLFNMWYIIQILKVISKRKNIH